MTYVLIFSGALLLLILWSAAVWAFHGLGLWAVSGAGALGASAGGTDVLALPAWLAAWLPAPVIESLTALTSSLLPWVQALLTHLPMLDGALTFAAWLIWSLGAAVLVVSSLGASAALKLWRRRARRSPTGVPAASVVR